jgi:A/G-specific adenine glycosylase
VSFSSPLLHWYYTQNISLPWRGETDLYKIWLSEVMLQQTQVSTVIPYYQKWLKKFPTIASVANANEEEILKYWEGLGYYSRARNFQDACKVIQHNYNGILPESSSDFLNLKGVGEYIYSAVFSIGLNEKVPVIDGNVKRVISRFLGLLNEVNSEIKNIQSFLNNEILSIEIPGDFNQAMMDLGRTVCKPKNPNCENCPINSNCIALKDNKIDLIPVKAKKKNTPHYNMVVGIVEKNDKILLCKRKNNGLLGGMWELPGGKMNPEETQKKALNRVFNNFGLTFKSQHFLGKAKHKYSHFSIEQNGYICDYKSGDMISDNHSEYRWISYDEKSNYPIHVASHKLLNKIKE